MRFRRTAATLLASTTAVVARIDVENLARAERAELAGCFSDSMTVIEKYQLADSWFGLSNLLQATCAVEIERTKSAAKNQLRGEGLFIEDFAPGAVVNAMFDRAWEVYRQQKVTACSETNCVLDQYRSCLMRRMSGAVKAQIKPADFEKEAEQHCEDFESTARAALTNDFNNVLKLHFAHGMTHQVNDAIVDILDGLHHDVVVLSAEDLAKVQPGRKSCKPQMCGASPCISLNENEPSEYECVINQK